MALSLEIFSRPNSASRLMALCFCERDRKKAKTVYGMVEVNTHIPITFFQLKITWNNNCLCKMLCIKMKKVIHFSGLLFCVHLSSHFHFWWRPSVYFHFPFYPLHTTPWSISIYGEWKSYMGSESAVIHEQHPCSHNTTARTLCKNNPVLQKSCCKGKDECKPLLSCCGILSYYGKEDKENVVFKKYIDFCTVAEVNLI